MIYFLLGYKIVENPTWESIREEAHKAIAILVLYSIEQEEIDKIIKFYGNPNMSPFKIIFIHKYTDPRFEIETIFGMEKRF